MTYKLFIDDERMPPNDGENWIITRTKYDVFMSLIKYGMPKFISFDHDLGENQETGYDITKALVESDMNGTYIFPENFNFYVHSQNPVGKENIEYYLRNYLRVTRGTI